MRRHAGREGISGTTASRQDLRGRQLLANLDASLAQPQAAGQSASTPRQAAEGVPPATGGPYDFLVGHLIDRPTLGRAEVLAFEWQVSVPRGLAALGWIGEKDYVGALAGQLGLAVLDGRRPRVIRELREPGLLGAEMNGVPCLVADGLAVAPDTLRTFVTDSAMRGFAVLLATPTEMDMLRHGPGRAWRLDAAIHGLGHLDRSLSAAAPLARWQKIVLPLLVILTAASVALAPGATIPALLVLLTVPFLCVAFIRLAGLHELRRRTRVEPPAPDRGNDWTLPIYSVLVPLYDEAEVLPRLMRQLSALDYPAARLDILVVLEAADQKTRQAAAALDPPGNVRIIVVPEGGPRTKPKACNFALGLVHGDYVVVYDAEDRPESGQLRQALARFAADDATLACVQARLNTYNPDAGFLTRGLMAHPPL